MASNIDATKPEQGQATTESVRQNFAAAKEEIESIQQEIEGLGTGLTGIEVWSAGAATNITQVNVSAISGGLITGMYVITTTAGSSATVFLNESGLGAGSSTPPASSAANQLTMGVARFYLNNFEFMNRTVNLATGNFSQALTPIARIIRFR